MPDTEQKPAPTRSKAFDVAVAFLIDRLEGGAKVITDSGGKTRFGISQKAYPDLDIEHLSRGAAEALYLRDYWLPVRAEELEPGLGLLLFDAAVNAGPGQAVKLLQRVLSVEDDGRVGPVTLAAARGYLELGRAGSAELRARYSEIRLRSYEELARTKPVYHQYLYGWRMRVMRVADYAGYIGGLP